MLAVRAKTFFCTSQPQTTGVIMPPSPIAGVQGDRNRQVRRERQKRIMLRGETASPLILFLARFKTRSESLEAYLYASYGLMPSASYKTPRKIGIVNRPP